MKLIADENIPYANEAFSRLGEVTLLPDNAITREIVKDTTCLLIRSVTQVTEEMVAGSSLRFVGTATIGMDHVDQAALAAHDIAFSSAPGCNANSVSEYITSALLTLAKRHGLRLNTLTLGVVGVGNVGTRVVQKAKALGMQVLQNDPPRARAEGADAFTDLPDLLREADIVTMHVPLTREGEDATFGLCADTFFSAMKESAFFLNSSRGKVMDESALRRHLETGHLRGAVLDVWETEPGISIETLQAAELATPHIAGYSFDGKVTGTRMIYDAACKTLGITPDWDPTPLLPAPDVPDIPIDLDGKDEQDALYDIVSQLYSIEEDDARLREIEHKPIDELADYFRYLRKTYPRRREFMYTRIVPDNASDAFACQLQQLGFQV